MCAVVSGDNVDVRILQFVKPPQAPFPDSIEIAGDSCPEEGSQFPLDIRLEVVNLSGQQERGRHDH